MGYINIYKDWKSEKLDLELWNINWENVEIISKLPEWVEIIITDLKNYNNLTKTLKVNNK